MCRAVSRALQVMGVCLHLDVHCPLATRRPAAVVTICRWRRRTLGTGRCRANTDVWTLGPESARQSSKWSLVNYHVRTNSVFGYGIALGHRIEIRIFALSDSHDTRCLDPCQENIGLH